MLYQIQIYFTTALLLLMMVTSNAQNQNDMKSIIFTDEQQGVLNAVEK